MFLTVKDDYYKHVDNPIILEEAWKDGFYTKPVDIRECYFVPVADMWANILLDNLTLRKRYEEYNHIEELPFSVRFSVNVFLSIKENIKTKGGGVPFAKNGDKWYLYAGVVLSAETNEWRSVYVKLYDYETNLATKGMLASKVLFTLHGDVKKELPITTYRYSVGDKFEPIEPSFKKKQFVDFIDMEKRFYGKTAFIVIDHYRLGGRSLSKALDMDFDR